MPVTGDVTLGLCRVSALGISPLPYGREEGFSAIGSADPRVGVSRFTG